MIIRRILRFAGPISVALVFSVVFVFGVFVFLVGPKKAGEDLVTTWRNSRRDFAQYRSSSQLVRWWRCIGDNVPNLSQLAESGDKGLEVRFSWTQGYGEGDLYVTVNGEGEATARIKRHGSESADEYSSILPNDALHSVFHTIDSTRSLCLEPEKRDGYKVIDLGRFEISAETDTFSRTVFVDGTHGVPDSEAFGAVIRSFYDLDYYLGVNLHLGPFGTSTVRTDD
nr:hypothetical protein [uncultured bacterium]